MPSNTKKGQRNAAIERTGRALYGQCWIGEMKEKELEVARRFRGANGQIVALPDGAKAAVKVAMACFRARESDAQYGQVFRWLAEQGIDCTPGTFDVDAFDVWFRTKFPTAPMGATEVRLNTVRAELKKGQHPGRGGNVGWKKFCDTVRKKSGQRCDDRTIKRDVASLRANAK